MSNMKVSCTIELSYESPKHATQIYESVKVDDAMFMDSKRKQNSIQTNIETTSVSSMIHTVDDYLACVRVAENIIEKKK
jgi:tRNA threonylcarbamoyladenosine modification (KEOPS) complex  Pcc1 subunit